MATRHDLAIARMEKQVTDLSDAIAHLTTADDLRHLLQIIRRPGWTTPAELSFATALLKAMQYQVNAIVTLRSQLSRGGEQVLSSQDPIPPKAHVELEKMVTDLSDALANLKSDEDLKHLIQIIRRPGWTTPAELAFTNSILLALKAQTVVLATLTAQMMKSSDMVAEPKKLQRAK